MAATAHPPANRTVPRSLRAHRTHHPTWRFFMPNDTTAAAVKNALWERFGENFTIDPGLSGLDGLLKIAGHRSHRHYLPRPIKPELLRLLCACALSAPSKSDLQQCDI